MLQIEHESGEFIARVLESYWFYLFTYLNQYLFGISINISYDFCLRETLEEKQIQSPSFI